MRRVKESEKKFRHVLRPEEKREHKSFNLMPPPQPRKGGKEVLLSCVRGGGGDRLENLAVKKLGVGWGCTGKGL